MTDPMVEQLRALADEWDGQRARNGGPYLSTANVVDRIRAILGAEPEPLVVRERLTEALATVLARVRCQALHQQTNGGRCVNCISWAKTIGVPRHLPRLAGIFEDKATVQAEARDEGFIAWLGDTPLYADRAEWGNPYRADRIEGEQ